jgi:hypothetical protein
MEPQLPYEMLTADIGHLKNGNNFLAIADRFLGVVEMYDLKASGTSHEIISHILSFTCYFSNRIRRIYWDNASNLNSIAMDSWAASRDIILENSAAYNPAGNLFVETNIKCCKRAIGNMFMLDHTRKCSDQDVCERIKAINKDPVNGGLLAPAEILHHTKSTVSGFSESSEELE